MKITDAIVAAAKRALASCLKTWKSMTSKAEPKTYEEQWWANVKNESDPLG